jgi:hypothetical protein
MKLGIVTNIRMSAPKEYILKMFLCSIVFPPFQQFHSFVISLLNVVLAQVNLLLRTANKAETNQQAEKRV